MIKELIIYILNLFRFILRPSLRSDELRRAGSLQSGEALAKTDQDEREKKCAFRKSYNIAKFLLLFLGFNLVSCKDININIEKTTPPPLVLSERSESKYLSGVSSSEILRKEVIEDTKFVFIGIPRCGTFLINHLNFLLTGKKNGMNRLFKHSIFEPPKTFEKATQLFLPSSRILETCIKELLRDEFLLCHLTYKPEYEDLLIQNKVKLVLIIRHPCAQLVSRVFYTKTHFGYFPGLQYLSFDEMLSAYMGVGTLPEQKFEDLYSSHIEYREKPKYKAISNIVKFYEGYLPWMKSPICYTVKFEDLVGVNGGGSRESQINEIRKIAQHIGYKIDYKDAQEIANKLFGGTATFREGQIDGWKQYFKPEHKKAMAEIAGDLLDTLGYSI